MSYGALWDPRVTPGMIRKRLYQISKQELAWRKSTFDTRRNIWKVASRGVAKQQILNNLNRCILGVVIGLLVRMLRELLCSNLFSHRLVIN